MPKLPRLKVTTISKGRVTHSLMSRPTPCRPHSEISRGSMKAMEEPVEEPAGPAEPEESVFKGGHTGSTRQKIKERDAWEEVKKDLRMSFYESICPEEGLCIICEKKPDLLVTCRDCSRTGHVFCRDCAIKMHKQHCLLHTLVEWHNEEQVKCTYQCTFSRVNHACSTQYTRTIKVFTDKGQLHPTVFVRFCECEPSAATLVRYGLWPCSAQKPSTAISSTFMDMVYCMMMEGQVSLKAVCHAVGNHNCLSLNEVNLLYRSIVGECMEQFRYFRHMIRNLADIDREWNPTECSACPKEGPVFVSMDGNFGLVRKTSSGTSYHPPNQSAALFVHDGEMQSFLGSYEGTHKGHEDDIHVDVQKECSNFQAGTVIRTKNQSKKLATTGVFGAACRHGVPIVFINMEHGERLAYPVMAIKKILERLTPNTSIVILYDIACKLHAHLQKKGDVGQEILDKVKLVVPIFHAYGHKRTCQIQFGSKWSSGLGLTDGEVMERVWAFLRKFSHITKEMTPSHRVDLLTDALYYFAQKKLADIDIYIRAKMENAHESETVSTTELTSCLQQCGGTLADVSAWQDSERNASRNKQTPGTSLAWDEQYVGHIQEYDNLRQQLETCSDPQRVAILNSSCQKQESTIIKMERTRGIETRWQMGETRYGLADHRRQTKQKKELLQDIHRKACDHSFSVACRRKYSAGQTLAIRVARQIKSTAASLHKAIKGYNDKTFSSGDLPHTLAYQDVVDPEGPIFKQIEGSGLSPLQRNAVDLLNKQARCREEQHVLVREMRQFLHTMRQQHLALSQCVVNMGNEVSKQQKGLRHLISIKLMIIEGQHDRAAASFVQYIPDVQNLSGAYQNYCTNVDFFPSQAENADIHESTYTDYKNDLEGADNSGAEISEDEDFTDAT